MMFNNQVQPLYNETGKLMGVCIAADKWFENEKELEAILFPGQLSQGSAEAPAEPLKDWDVFLSYWDFNYPEEKKVKCDNCGSSTEDWTQDDPRKFILKAANIGGMVSFQCQQCNYRVTKKHFKDHICYECTPFTCKVG